MKPMADPLNKLRELLSIDKKTGIRMVQDIKDFLGGKSKIDRRKDTSGFGRSEEDFNERNRVEEKDSNLISFYETQVEQSIGKPVDPIIEFLIGHPFIFADEPNPPGIFVGLKGKNLSNIHSNFPLFPVTL